MGAVSMPLEGSAAVGVVWVVMAERIVAQARCCILRTPVSLNLHFALTAHEVANTMASPTATCRVIFFPPPL
jgi:hypothetical protein